MQVKIGYKVKKIINTVNLQGSTCTHCPYTQDDKSFSVFKSDCFLISCTIYVLDSVKH